METPKYYLFEGTFQTSDHLFTFLHALGPAVTYYTVTNQTIGIEKRDILLVTPEPLTTVTAYLQERDTLTLSPEHANHQTESDICEFLGINAFQSPSSLARAAAKQREQEQKAREALRCQQQAKEAENLFFKWFHHGPELVREFDGQIEDGGLLLKYNPNHRGFHIQGICPDCGSLCWSVACASLADIGDQLSTFQADRQGHRCPDNDPEPSWKSNFERLEEALKDYVFDIAEEVTRS